MDPAKRLAGWEDLRAWSAYETVKSHAKAILRKTGHDTLAHAAIRVLWGMRSGRR